MENIVTSTDRFMEELEEVGRSHDVTVKNLSTGRDKAGRIKRQTLRRSSSNRQAHVKVEYTKLWNDYEKQTLLNLLYEHGDKDLELLAAGLPNKHTSQVKTYLRTISRRAQLAEKMRTKPKEVLQLQQWVEFLKETYEMEPIDDTLPFELYSLSQEYISNKEITNDIVNFQKAYDYLLSLTVGQKSAVDERTYYFVHSYLEWFLKQFNKNVQSDGLALLSAAIKKVKGATANSTLTQEQALNIMFHKVLSTEQYLSNQHLLKTISSKLKRSNFKRIDEYEKKISLLRAEVGDESRLFNCSPDPLPCVIVPTSGITFKNLPSFIWTALFNTSIEDLEEIVNKK